MRNFFDNAIAVIGTIVLHALIIALVLVGVRWESTTPPPLRTTLKASVVSDEAFRLAEDEIEQLAAPEQPEPEPQVTEPPAPDPVVVEQERERVRAEQEAQAQREQAEAAQRQRELDSERERQAQAEKVRQAEAERERIAEAEQAREAEAERVRQAEAEAERERQAAEAAERERREAAEAERKRKEAEAERLRLAEVERKRRAEEQRKQALEAQLRDALEAEEARDGAIDAGLLARYVELIRQDVERNWNRPAGVPDGVRCDVLVRQLRDGQVVSVRVVDCAGGELLIRSIEAAVLKASPLPPPPDPSLFEPNLRFPFKTGE